MTRRSGTTLGGYRIESVSDPARSAQSSPGLDNRASCGDRARSGAVGPLVAVRQAQFEHRTRRPNKDTQTLSERCRSR